MSLLGRLRDRRRFGRIRLYDVSLGTDNLGDDIIMSYAQREIESLFPRARFVHLPTHRSPTDEEFGGTADKDISLVCGTNILCPDVATYNLWKMPREIDRLQNIVLMAVGANSYGEFTEESIHLYRKILSKRYWHSARDTYTYEKLIGMGIDNVLDTGCLTMWGLTPEHCSRIAGAQSSQVVFTLTANKSELFASKMVRTILDSYKEVFFWPQGNRDLDALRLVDVNLSRIHILPRTLDAYNELLVRREVDYVGTRLHGGIHALNKLRRAIIIEIDNRATEIAKSTGLPTLPMDRIGELGGFICSNIDYEIEMPWEAISRWRDQWAS